MMSRASLDARSSSEQIESLFERYSRLVFVIASRILRDTVEAEDVVQEVFLYVQRKLQLFDPAKGTEKSWIIQISITRALDRKIYLSRRGFYAHKHTDVLPLRGTTDTEREIEISLNRKLLQRAFSELTQAQRETLQFFFFEGLNLKDISERFREPLGSVRHHFYRGLQRLRRSSILQNIS